MEAKSSESSSILPPIALNELVPNVPFEIYKASDGFNASGAKQILRSAAHYFEHRYNRIEEKETDAKRFGRLVHFAVLEPQLFREKSRIEPIFEGYTQKGEKTTNPNCKEVKEAKAKWYSELPDGAIVVPHEDADKLMFMANKILNHPVAAGMLREGVRETVLWWKDDATGELCKARPDFISPKWGPIDLKTTTDAEPEHFWRDCKKYGYDIQCAHYLEGGRISKTFRSDNFTFLVIEKDPPYEIAVYPAGPSSKARGERLREKAMRRYAECRKTNHWPGYNPEARMLDYPDYIMANELYEDEDENEEQI